MSSRKHDARIAGFLYLLLAAVAPINMLYLQPSLIVRGDATATASRIMSSMFLFRVSIAFEFALHVIFLLVIWTLYRLLKDVDPMPAVLMVLLSVTSVAVGFVNSFNHVAARVVLSGADFLSAFAQPQLNAMAYLFIRLHGQGEQAVSMFWGLWLFPFGLLVWRSRFIPKIFGVFLIISGAAYVAGSFTNLIAPQYSSNYFLIPESIGELAIIFWLVIKGVSNHSLETPAISTVPGGLAERTA
ncbi:MAG: DUF4386 domain-containing protein [Thermoanaerobaculia bacterium]